MRKVANIILLAVLLTASAYPAMGSYIYHMPVVVQSTLSPEVLMPGDTAILTVQLKNGAAQYGIGEDTSGMTLSTPVNRTTLTGTDEIAVLNGDHNKVGMIGPADEVVLYYNIKANESIADRTYFLDFCVEAGYDSMEICRQIPVKVDSTTLSISRAELPSDGKISLDVANPRQNTLNAVTIVPDGRGVEFSPEKYYIGTMKPDEIFTIEFDLNSLAPSEANNLSFKSIFKNGDTWHTSESYFMNYKSEATSSSKAKGAPANAGMGTMAAAAVIILAGLLGGVYLWRRRTGKP